MGSFSPFVPVWNVRSASDLPDFPSLGFISFTLFQSRFAEITENVRKPGKDLNFH